MRRGATSLIEDGQRQFWGDLDKMGYNGFIVGVVTQ